MTEKKHNLKKLTILHSNDLHGDFLSQEVDDKLMGGTSMLSGYVQSVRAKEKNVLYLVAGDMFRGSVIDSEYKGMSTIEIMNLLGPDVVTIGNHEVDYGLAHLLFIEKCAKFPIINANLYIKTNHTRLFKPHMVLKVGGIKILLIGIITEEILASTKQEAIIGSFVDIEEASKEIGRITDTYRTEDIDFTIVMTHIGIEEDKKLAAILDPDYGVDIIVGGHSHTLMSEPVVINGIPIVQAAKGTQQIGRFDIVVDKDNNCIDSYTWQCVPIDEDHCPRDKDLEKVIKKFKNVTDRKYERIVTRLPHVFTHPLRCSETELGTFFADVFKRSLGVDICMLGSGSVRKQELGPIIEYKNLLECFPYNEPMYRITATGKQLRQMVTFILRDEAWTNETEFYQWSEGVKIVWSKSKHLLKELSFNGKEVEDDDRFDIAVQEFHYSNLKDFLTVSLEDFEKNKKSRKLSTASLDVLDEFLGPIELATRNETQRLYIEE